MSEDLYSLYMSSSPTFVSPPLFTTVYLRIRRIFIDRYSLSFIVFIFPCEMRRPCEEPAPSMASTKGGIYIKLLGHGSNIYDNYVIGEKEKEVSRLGDHWRCWGCVHMLGLCLSTCNCTRPQPGVIIVLLSASPFSLLFLLLSLVFFRFLRPVNQILLFFASDTFFSLYSLAIIFLLPFWPWFSLVKDDCSPLAGKRIKQCYQHHLQRPLWFCGRVLFRVINLHRCIALSLSGAICLLSLLSL